MQDTQDTHHDRFESPAAQLGRARRLRTAAGLRDERGQALVEIALVLPVLLLILFGITQFALALNSANDQTHIANELARYATVNENPGGSESLQAWGKKQADKGEEAKGTICISFPNGSSNPGDPVKVEFKSTINWLPGGKSVNEALKGLSHFPITGSATMRLEQSPSTYSAGCV
jgi:TadE-like protein